MKTVRIMAFKNMTYRSLLGVELRSQWFTVSVLLFHIYFLFRITLVEYLWKPKFRSHLTLTRCTGMCVSIENNEKMYTCIHDKYSISNTNTWHTATCIFSQTYLIADQLFFVRPVSWFPEINAYKTVTTESHLMCVYCKTNFVIRAIEYT